jgi:tRNA pseudouridine55 synthase
MDGSIIIDKPSGVTSHDVVVRVRRAVRTRKVGHAGTLDPLATGVLIVCIGRATRLIQFLVGLDKEYLATVRLGFATDTHDSSGRQITPLVTPKHISIQKIEDLLSGFLGRQLQLPPMFSAKKIAGQKLYVAARAGLELEREPVPVQIHSIQMVGDEPLRENPDGTFDLLIRVRCSSGTYIRWLAHELGRRLGIGAHLAKLRRTAVGQFSLERAVTVELVEEMARNHRFNSLLISPSDTVGHLPAISVDEARARRISNGGQVDAPEADQFPPATIVRLCDARGDLIAIGKLDPLARKINPKVVLARY